MGSGSCLEAGRGPAPAADHLHAPRAQPLARPLGRRRDVTGATADGGRGDPSAAADRGSGARRSVHGAAPGTPLPGAAPLPRRRERRPARRFFNPVPRQRLVEVVPSQLTEDDAVRRAEEFVVGGLGKTAIRAPDRAGFIVNALPLLRRLVAAGRLGRKPGRGFYEYHP
ncbi:3-hydroxyacyl-CoA dehydrogenase NAD-binding domain-containing protein [Yinghuangia seranimata]|uniref:3-hydroxyacyl-CoA dehydrogenase NAD-binding domain-containing protein n=1 Tax=Yinghuangia seranimata TaxID=408067 RepID=UPI003CCF0574